MKILMTMFGWTDAGGGTIYPRLIAQKLQRRGHQILVLYASLQNLVDHPPYTLTESEEEGIQLIGIHNRPAIFMDDKNPDREVNDPQMVQIMAHFLNTFQPDVVHFHNLLGFSMGVARPVYENQIPSLMSIYNHWIVCPTLYLSLPTMEACLGVNADGSNCLNCTRVSLPGERYVNRRNRLRDDGQHFINKFLVTCQATKDIMMHNGYLSEHIDVLFAENERSVNIWNQVGAHRKPTVPETIHFGFMGSVIPIKGVHVLVEAVQQLKGDFSVTIYGDGPQNYIQRIKNLDSTGRIHFAGWFEDENQPQILKDIHVGIVPSVCQEPGAFVTGEFQAALAPVLGSHISGIPEYIQPGAGTTFEVNNPIDLAAKMQQLIDHPEQVMEWQKNIQAPQSFEAYIDELENHYTQVIKKNAPQKLERTLHQIFEKRSTSLPQTTSWHLPGSKSEISILDWHGDPIAQPSSQQIWVSTLSQLKQFQQRYPDLQKRVQLVPLTVSALISHEKPMELDTTCYQKWLSFFQIRKSNWQKVLTVFLNNFSVQDGIAYILVAYDATLEEVHEILSSWLEDHAFDMNKIPELILLDWEEIKSSLSALMKAANAYITVADSDESGWFSLQAIATELPVGIQGELPLDDWAILGQKDTILQNPHLQRLDQVLPFTNWLKADASFAKKWNQQVFQQALQAIS